MGFFRDVVEGYFTPTLRGVIRGGLLGVSLWAGLCTHTPALYERIARPLLSAGTPLFLSSSGSFD
jgi:hypothetical protein